MENEEKMLASGATDNMGSMSSPKGTKRCATEPLRCPENTSTPNHSVKKRLALDCDKTPLVSPISKSTNHASTTLTPGQTVSTTRMLNITRGIQTIRPEVANRYCQVSVARKPTATVDVQTEECLLGPSQPPPPPVVLIEAASQTDEPLLKITTVGTTQTESTPSAQRAVVSRPPELVEESTEGQNEENVEQHQNQREETESDLETDEHGALVQSITTILNDIAKQYGIDLESPVKEKKKKSSSKKKEIEQLQECLANKTYKAIASKVNKKMSSILEKHMTVYGRETVASRQRLIRWTKQFIRRQQQHREAASEPLRKTILVRNIVRAPKRPAVEEKAIQCVQQLDGITVATQWQRQRPMVPGPGDRCAKLNCPATPKNRTMGKTSKEGSSGSGSNKENIPPNHQHLL